MKSFALCRAGIAAVLVSFAAALPAAALEIRFTNPQPLPWEVVQIEPAPTSQPPAPVGRALAYRDQLHREWIVVQAPVALLKGASVVRGAANIALAS